MRPRALLYRLQTRHSIIEYTSLLSKDRRNEMQRKVYEAQILEISGLEFYTFLRIDIQTIFGLESHHLWQHIAFEFLVFGDWR